MKLLHESRDLGGPALPCRQGMVAWPRTFQSKRLAWSSPEDRQWLPLTDSPHATHVLSFPICRSFPAVTCLDSRITARCLPQPTPEARNNLPRICYTRTPCWPLEEKEALPFRSWTIWFLATSWGNSGLNESFSCPWKSHRMQLAGTKSCRGSPRASAIPQKASCSTLPVTNGLTAETLPPLNSPAKEDCTCLLYQSIHTERPLKTSRFYLFFFFLQKREGMACMDGWLLESSTQASVSLEPGTELTPSDLVQKRVNDCWHTAAQGTELSTEESSNPQDTPPSLSPGNIRIRTLVRINVLPRWDGYRTPSAPLLMTIRLGLNQLFISCSKKVT